MKSPLRVELTLIKDKQKWETQVYYYYKLDTPGVHQHHHWHQLLQHTCKMHVVFSSWSCIFKIFKEQASDVAPISTGISSCFKKKRRRKGGGTKLKKLNTTKRDRGRKGSFTRESRSISQVEVDMP